MVFLNTISFYLENKYPYAHMANVLTQGTSSYLYMYII